MLEKVVIAAVSALLGGAGTLWLRWLRKDRVTEEINRKRLKAQLVANMREWGVSQADIDAVSSWAEGNVKHAAVQSDQDKIEEQEFAEIAAANTQADMNLAQGRRLERLEKRMGDALEKLRTVVAEDDQDDKMRKALDASQTVWEDYRDHMADFAGAAWSGGTMQPFVEAGIKSRLTKDRAADLEIEIANLTPDSAP